MTMDSFVDFARVVALTLPAIITLVALLVTIDQAAYREFQKVVIDIVNQTIDEISAVVDKYVEFKGAESHSEAARCAIDSRISALQRRLTGMAKQKTLPMDYVAPILAFKRAIQLHGMDPNDFKLPIQVEVYYSKADLESYLNDWKMKVVTNMRGFPDAIRRTSFAKNIGSACTNKSNPA